MGEGRSAPSRPHSGDRDDARIGRPGPQETAAPRRRQPERPSRVNRGRLASNDGPRRLPAADAPNEDERAMQDMMSTLAGLSVCLEAALGVLSAVSMVVAAELLARHAEGGAKRKRAAARTSSGPALAADAAAA